jgi:hypothetical protein
LALIDVPMTWRDTRRDCGKPGCPNDIPTRMSQEATEALGMGGGPSLMYAADAISAFEEFQVQLDVAA